MNLGTKTLEGISTKIKQKLIDVIWEKTMAFSRKKVKQLSDHRKTASMFQANQSLFFTNLPDSWWRGFGSWRTRHLVSFKSNIDLSRDSTTTTVVLSCPCGFAARATRLSRYPLWRHKRLDHLFWKQFRVETQARWDVVQIRRKAIMHIGVACWKHGNVIVFLDQFLS